jgi:cytochrome P450
VIDLVGDYAQAMIGAMKKSATSMANGLEKKVRDGGGCLEPNMNGYMKHVTTNIIACIVFGSSYEERRKMFEQEHAFVNLVRQR